MRAKIFVTDDEAVLRSALVKRLGRRHQEARAFATGDALLDALNEELPDLILLDIRMPGMNGLETLKAVRHKAPDALVIMLTAYGSIEEAVSAMRLGAYDFLIKTVDLMGLDEMVDRALELLALRRRIEVDREQEGNPYLLSNLVAKSPAMQQLLAQLHDVARNHRTTVLLQGETGTGKEYIARVIHYNGSRASGPFIAVNCTAIPRELFESELFGYERGAFTGASQRKLGLMEKAEGGTLFLDEIGDLDPALQAKLLRVLQDRSFRRVGGMEDIDVDFRLIAATNRDLKREVGRGAFREDLYFRLNVVTFELPALRHRSQDIIPLCERAMVRIGKELSKDVHEIDAEAQGALSRYPYPGNIRELENIIERALIFCRGTTLTLNCLPEEIREPRAQTAAATVQGPANAPVIRIEMHLGAQTLAEVESAIIEEVLRVAGHNKTLAAKHLGLTRFALDRRLRKLEDAAV